MYDILAVVSINRIIAQRGIDADLKRIIAAGIVMLLLLFMVTASASTAGTASNPLITLSHINGTFAPSLKTENLWILESATTKAINKLDEIYGAYAEYDFATDFTRVSIATGDMVMLSMGSSFILLSGSATLNSANGAVINVSAGGEAAAGSQLAQYQRYFCAEDTTAIIIANSASVGQVDGYYLVETTAANRTHPVFRDVREKDWYYPAVDFVYNNGLFGGTAPNTFSPATPMTRGMFVTVLYRLEGEPAVDSGGQFSDVWDTTLYYYNAVTWANANDIVLGYSNGTFGVNNPVTREQIATIIYRYAAYKGRDMSPAGSAYSAFSDRGNVSGYAVDAMQWVVSKGVINGSNGMLLPRNTATRAEVAQIINNYVEKIRNKG